MCCRDIADNCAVVSRDHLRLLNGRTYDSEPGHDGVDRVQFIRDLLPEVEFEFTEENLPQVLAEIQQAHDRAELEAAGFQVEPGEVRQGVYLVNDNGLGVRRVAKRFRRLAEWGEVPRVQHENVVRLVQRVGNMLIMEEIKGTTWKTEWILENLAPKEVHDLLHGLWSGLGELHARKTGHGDIWWKNIILPERTRGVLIDWTGDGVTNGIRAPEDQKGGAKVPQTDVYKLGVLSSWVCELEIFKRCQAENPDDRPTAAEVIAVIEKEQGKIKRWLKIALGAAALILMGLLLWLNRYNPRFVELFREPVHLEHVCAMCFDEVSIESEKVRYFPGTLFIIPEEGDLWFETDTTYGVFVTLKYFDNQPYLVLETKKGIAEFYLPRMFLNEEVYFPDEHPTSAFVYPGCESNYNFSPIQLVNRWSL